MSGFYEHGDEPTHSVKVYIFLIRYVVAFQESPYFMPSVDVCREWTVSGAVSCIIAKFIGPNFCPSCSTAHLKPLAFSVKMYGF
jgi:hypothetical protein